MEPIQLSEFDLVIIKQRDKDSLVALFETCRIAKEQGFPLDKIHVSHQDLGAMEWSGTKELAATQAKFFDLPIHYSKQKNKAGKEETLLEYVEKRGKWPSNKQRFCTSDFKRGPGATVVTRLTKNLGECKVLHIFGFRADESPSRSKKEVFCLNKRLSTQKRTVYDFLPVHTWTTERVWSTIKENGLPYHFAYDLGMPRLSCCFCIFSPFDALIIAGKANPELLDKYVAVEKKIGHTFKNGSSIQSVKEAIDNGYTPDKVNDWIM